MSRNTRRRVDSASLSPPSQFLDDDEFDDLADNNWWESEFQDGQNDAQELLEDAEQELQEMSCKVQDQVCNPQTAAAIAMYQASKMKRLRTIAAIIAASTEAVRAYVKWRGGIQEMRAFVIPNVTFDLDSMDEKDCQFYFRFEKEEIHRVVAALGIPKYVTTTERDKCLGIDVFCMMCAKFAWPTRLGTLRVMFGSSLPRISRLVAALRSWLCNRFYAGMNDPKQLSDAKIAEFAAAVERVSGVPIVFSFLDGTVRPICKPDVLQHPMYNGKDRVHALKFQ